MARQPRPGVVYDTQPSEWGGFTHRNHLFSRFADTPVEALDIMEQVNTVNNGMLFYNYVMGHSYQYLDMSADGRFSWDLVYSQESADECLGAYLDEDGVTEITDTHFPGINNGTFYMDFEGKPYSETEIIVGENPNLNRLQVVSVDNISGDIWRYGVVLDNSTSATDFIDYQAVLAGSMWTWESGAVPRYLSDKGVDIRFKTYARAESDLSSFRMQHTLAGHNIDYKPKKFYYVDGNTGKIVKEPMWLTAVEYEFMQKVRVMTANTIVYGRTNIDPNTGRAGNIADNGYEIIKGSGWNEQTSASQHFYWTGRPDYDQVLQIILDITEDYAFGTGNKVLVRSGRHGLIELSNMVKRKLGDSAWTPAFMGDTTGRAYKWAGNDIKVNMGQIWGVADVNGIELTFMHDPSKDTSARNHAQMPGLPGPVSSYQYDFIGLGDQGENANMKIVRRKGDEPIFGTLEGVRGFLSNKGSFKSPKALASAVDGSTLHYFEPGIGALVINPRAVAKYWPDVQPYN